MFDLSQYIVYEDDVLMVINKPKGLLVHHTSYTDKDTLVDLIKDKIDIKSFINQERSGIVHRLDQYTSGLMIVAKNQGTLENLQNQIVNDILIRKYRAIVHHCFNEEKLLINVPIARSQSPKLKFVASDSVKAKEAITEVNVIQNLRDAALVECILSTGRTHQIRVHMQYIHHPIFNDLLYGHDDGYGNYQQFLYSSFLQFTHPVTNKLMQFQIEPDPTFNELLKKLSMYEK